MIFWSFLVGNYPFASIYFIFLLNKVVLPRRFRFHLVFCVVIVLSQFGLLPSYYSVWFVIGLLRRGVVCRLIAAFYLCGGDLDKKNEFD